MACLVAIVIAGGVKLFQISSDDTKVVVLDFGTRAVVGEMKVSPLSLTEQGQQTVIEVEIGGVVDEDGGKGWRLLVDGKVREPVGADATQTKICSATTLEIQICRVVFNGVGAGATVAYVRAGEQRQWVDK